MKTFSHLLPTMVVGGVLALVLALASAAPAAQQGQAVVRALRGAAEFSTGGGAWAPLKVGMVLHAGTIVKTASKSEMDLFLKENGPIVRVTADTILGLDKLIFDNTGAETVIETQLDLKSGRILGNIKKTSVASHFEIKTPTGVAGIRGTLFDISANGVVKVKKEGAPTSVVVVYVDPSGAVSTYVVNGGQKFVPGVGVVAMTPEENESSDWTGLFPPTGQPAAALDNGALIFVSPNTGAPPPPN